MPPDHLAVQVNPTRTRKVCMYPKTPRYVDTDSTDDEASFECEVRDNDDPDLLRQEAGLLRGNGPVPCNFDVGKARLMNNDGVLGQRPH